MNNTPTYAVILIVLAALFAALAFFGPSGSFRPKSSYHQPHNERFFD